MAKHSTMTDDTAYLRAVGMRVRLARVQRRLSQEALGALSGVSRVTVGSVERGDHPGSVLAYHKLAKALDMRISDLLDDE